VINLFLGIFQPRKSRIPLWQTPDNDNQTQADVQMIQQKGGDYMLKTDLPANWWQRPFRGFEAKLPVQLMCNIDQQL
jgi:hypothetical protein